MSPLTGPPERCIVAGSCSVRSGEIFSQLCPSLRERQTYWLVTKSDCGSCGESMTGNVHWKRCGTSATAQPS